MVAVSANEQVRDPLADYAFLAEAGTVLAASLDYDATMTGLARFVVPRLCDWCVIYVAEDDGLRPAGVAHADPALGEALREHHARYPLAAHEASPVWAVLRTGQPIWANDPSELDLRAASVDEAQFRFLRDVMQVRAGMIVPMVCRGRSLGAMCLQMSTSGRRYGPGSLAVAEGLAQVAALAVDNARLYRAACQGMRAREVVLSIASHELRTPLNALLLRIQALLSGVHRGKQEGLSAAQLGELLECFERQVRRMIKLVGQLLDVSQIAVGPLGLQRERCDLAAIAREVSAHLAPELARAGCALALDADQPVPGYWDRLRLEQVLINLLSNAMKYGAGQPITVAVAAEHGLARMSVENGGKGIAAQDLERIFEPFQRASPVGGDYSLGLGLYIIRSIVEAHGGKVRVASQPGGTTFTVELPRRGLSQPRLPS